MLDAKYKFYQKLGRKEKERGAISREDLYQMTSYLWHYQQKYKRGNRKLLGLFVSPSENEINPLPPESEIDRLKTETQAINLETKAFHHISDVKIGVINLPLPKSEGTDDSKRNFASVFNQIIPEYEKQFAAELEKLISDEY